MITTYAPSLPRMAEAMIADIAKDSGDRFNSIIEDLMADGVPFGQEKLSEKALLERYLGNEPGAPNLHSDANACGEWIAAKVQQMTEMLANFGVPPEAIAQCHPWEIVITQALRMSAKREAALERQAERARTAQPETVPFVPDEQGMNDGEPANAGL